LCRHQSQAVGDVTQRLRSPFPDVNVDDVEHALRRF